MKFTTETGSHYEVDGNKVRRLTGTHDPTPRQGRDGEWRETDVISTIEVGETVLMVWDFSAGEATVTSRVVEVEE